MLEQINAQHRTHRWCHDNVQNARWQCHRLILLTLMTLYPTVNSFVVPYYYSFSNNNNNNDHHHHQQRQHQHHSNTYLYSQKGSVLDKPEKVTNNNNNNDDEDDASDAAVWKLNASGSFGSLLMQMQRKEEEMMKKNETMKALDLNHHYVREMDTVEPPEIDVQIEQSDIETLDVATARELDDAVVRLTGSRVEDLEREITVLPLSPLYQALTNTTQANVEDLLPLSRPEHFHDRIGRDIRLLAISIAASTESASQWRKFCQEKGGLYPLLTVIHEGAQSIQNVTAFKQAPETPTAWLDMWSQNEQEASFLASCNACRALRDVCAISPELAAVVTDGILRANAALGGGLMNDFKTFLEYANNFKELSSRKEPASFRVRLKRLREARLRCKLYVNQLLLSMVLASDDAITAIRETIGLKEALVACSSYAIGEKQRRWLRYPVEIAKYLWRRKNKKRADRVRRPFVEAASVGDDLKGQVLKHANLVLAGIGYNQWYPKMPGQKGLRILSLDGGGSRGMTAVTAVNCLMEYVGKDGEVPLLGDSFDIIAGTSTGGIISFLTGLRGESSGKAVRRYNQLIKQIFVKSALATTRMVFTTASYDESHFMGILSGILNDATMLDSRADPAVPYVFCVSSKMSSTPTHVSLFRNYNYANGELADHFVIDPLAARDELGIPIELEHELIRSGLYARKQVTYGSPGVRTSEGSRHPGSFRVLQRYALRASTAAPTVFKPVMMGGEMYCDGGIVASNPTHVAIHEARALFPDIPIELVVSIGTGGFLEQRSKPRLGWDGIIGQIVGSATDGEQVHHILEDLLDSGNSVMHGRGSSVSRTRYFRFNPVIGMPDEFPIDVTDPEKLSRLQQITKAYMSEPKQKEKMGEVARILSGKRRWWRQKR